MKALVYGPGDAGLLPSATSPSSLLPLAHLALINGALIQPHSSRELLLALGLHSSHYEWKLPVLCPALFSGKDIITIDDCETPLPQNAIPQTSVLSGPLVSCLPGSYLSSLSLLTVSDSAFIPVIVECQSPYLTIGLSPHLACRKCP